MLVYDEVARSEAVDLRRHRQWGHSNGAMPHGEGSCIRNIAACSETAQAHPSPPRLQSPGCRGVEGVKAVSRLCRGCVEGDVEAVSRVRPSLTYVEVSRLVSRVCRGCVSRCRGYVEACVEAMCRGYVSCIEVALAGSHNAQHM